MTPDLSAKSTVITPNVCDDMHTACSGNGTPIEIQVGGTSSEMQTGGKYLSTLMPMLINSPQYKSGNTVIFVAWEEGVSTDNQVLTEVWPPPQVGHATVEIRGRRYPWWMRWAQSPLWAAWVVLSAWSDLAGTLEAGRRLGWNSRQPSGVCCRPGDSRVHPRPGSCAAAPSPLA
ncbi:hypothetical protein [Mycobacterium sp. URHB0021]